MHHPIKGHQKPVLRAGVIGLASWEQVALMTGLVPSISTCVWTRPFWQRAGIAFVAFLFLFDHFATRRYL